MTKWEYKSVELIRHEDALQNTYFHEVIFDSENDTKEVTLSEPLKNTEVFANKYGKDGWELVTVQYMPPNTMMWFKRPISNNTKMENVDSTLD